MDWGAEVCEIIPWSVERWFGNARGGVHGAAAITKGVPLGRLAGEGRPPIGFCVSEVFRPFSGAEGERDEQGEEDERGQEDKGTR